MQTIRMVKVAYTSLKMTNKPTANLIAEKGRQPKHKVIPHRFTGQQKNPHLRFAILLTE